MSKMKFDNGDPIVILKIGTDDYIQEVVNATSPFALMPGSTTVSPSVEYWQASADTECDVDLTQYIRDNANIHFAKIVGPRPRNIFKR